MNLKEFKKLKRIINKVRKSVELSGRQRKRMEERGVRIEGGVV